ncbi:MAG TPA: DoxX family protein [Bryobacteraceae bacterium]|nr:DoxX family protein [Bryobacteraceae bacterium]
MRRALYILARLALAGVFLWSAIAKLRDPWMLFAMEIDNMHVIPGAAVEFVARTLPWFELVLGLALASGVWARYVSPVAMALAVSFFSLVTLLYFQGFKGDCGCFGPGEQLGPKTVARDFSFVLLSIWVTWEAFRRRRGAPAN